jgi:hypothetical protein
LGCCFCDRRGVQFRTGRDREKTVLLFRLHAVWFFFGSDMETRFPICKTVVRFSAEAYDTGDEARIETAEGFRRGGQVQLCREEGYRRWRPQADRSDRSLPNSWSAGGWGSRIKSFVVLKTMQRAVGRGSVMLWPRRASRSKAVKICPRR